MLGSVGVRAPSGVTHHEFSSHENDQGVIPTSAGFDLAVDGGSTTIGAAISTPCVGTVWPCMGV